MAYKNVVAMAAENYGARMRTRTILATTAMLLAIAGRLLKNSNVYSF
jgi:hypothetical protein